MLIVLPQGKAGEDHQSGVCCRAQLGQPLVEAACRTAVLCMAWAGYQGFRATPLEGCRVVGQLLEAPQVGACLSNITTNEMELLSPGCARPGKKGPVHGLQEKH